MKKITSFLVCLSIILAASPAFAQFKDVHDTTSLATEINYLVNEKVIAGYPDGTFRPNEVLKKKHVATMLVRALNLPTNAVTNPNYKDVPTTHLYYKEIAAAQNAGLFSKAENFQPESSISRGFMAQLLAKAYQLKELPVAEGEGFGFTDLPQNHPYFPAVRLAIMNNIVNGYEDGSFQPNKLLTRAHFSAFLARADSMRFDSFTPIRTNRYYYNVSANTEIMLQYKGRDQFNNEVWSQTLQSKESLSNIIYSQNARSFLYGIEDGMSYILPIPATVGWTASSYPDGVTKVIDTIMTTKGTLTMNGKTYKDLVVVRTVSHEASSLHYFAKDLGLIASRTMDGNFEWALTKVEKRD